MTDLLQELLKSSDSHLPRHKVLKLVHLVRQRGHLIGDELLSNLGGEEFVEQFDGGSAEHEGAFPFTDVVVANSLLCLGFLLRTPGQPCSSNGLGAFR